MTVKNLINKLKELPQDSIVAGYAGNAEASFVITGIEVVTEDSQPYDKGEQLYDKIKQDGHESTKQIVLLSGHD